MRVAWVGLNMAHITPIRVQLAKAITWHNRKKDWEIWSSSDVSKGESGDSSHPQLYPQLCHLGCVPAVLSALPTTMVAC